MRKILTLDMMPKMRKKEDAYTHKRLGLIKKSKTISKTFRLRVDTNEMLTELAEKVNKKLKINKINRTQVLELLIIDAHANTSRIIEILKH